MARKAAAKQPAPKKPTVFGIKERGDGYVEYRTGLDAEDLKAGGQMLGKMHKSDTNYKTALANWKADAKKKDLKEVK